MGVNVDSLTASRPLAADDGDSRSYCKTMSEAREKPKSIGKRQRAHLRPGSRALKLNACTGCITASVNEPCMGRFTAQNESLGSLAMV